MPYGGLHSHPALIKHTDSYLSYRNPNPQGPVESCPIVFNGKIWTVTHDSMSGNDMGTIRIDGGLERPLSRVSISDFRYICAIVEGTRLYVFGTSADHQRIRMMYSDDLKTFSTPVTVFTSTNGYGFYNTSVSKTPNGFVMAAEVTDPAFPNIPFVCRFLTSTNLTSWSLVPGGLYNNNVFVNCPTIRYVAKDNKYYLLYMSSANGGMMTFISRSSDLIHWQNSSGLTDGLTVPFCPLAYEGNNNSDVDLIDFEGRTYFTYARGDQTAWLELCTAMYAGKSEDFLTGFF